ncbi:glycopeptide antibiotics resistance protein [Lactobacillus nasalidis]|uniref:Glycopeptide antibiotics resistance protein n=1 Tax=Lactobacillus nasalidis TaxID=2797258 RepID=A0ABQ3W3G6_9LACO|nr:VanZ family protein [Lactobacillus nasalidis]GHV97537.1 glycopeptide antibiotics resistance protein [Lactobacillus nasalidis]GHW00204.1 glycopeptide antibiotics resistance protein [Lactobacillus nasalidis]GHW00821.1 glycopeptide antibiotics resistance protein [Lactobacillus nasalidis]
MLFLAPLYNLLANQYATRINHFALIKLTLQGLDKTIFYFLIFALLRVFWLLAVRKRRSLRSEFGLWLFVFYFLLVLMLTTFRSSYFPWELNFHWNRSLSNINLVFMKNTWKLIYAKSKVDFYYNSFGNILAFVPFGALMPNALRIKHCFWRVFLLGLLASVTIEILQFLLLTGVSDIDDVFFNGCGVLLGYGLYHLLGQICVKNRNKD